MLDWGLWSYQVLIFERLRDGRFVSSSSYRECALATFATHDLPTLAGWLQGSDLDLRQTLGLASSETREQRQLARDALRRALGVSAGEQTDFAAVARFIASTPARLAMVSLEDLMEVREQINVPGTSDGYPNWRRRLPAPLEDVLSCGLMRRVASEMAVAGRSFVARY
jgi:4-alpha-glucanotransferase